MSTWNWNENWVFEGEGPLTILIKFQSANIIDSIDANKYIFGKKYISSTLNKGRHSRSLVTLNWPSKASEVDFLRNLLITKSLGKLCGNWAPRIATDRNIRFCEKCLDKGFLPACLQVSGIYQCPIHHIKLKDRCSHCMHPTLPYALNQCEKSPLYCSKCHIPYSEKWVNLEKNLKWSGISMDEGLKEINLWLERLRTSKLEWTDLDAWYPDTDSYPGTSAHAECVLKVLCSVIDQSPSALRQTYSDSKYLPSCKRLIPEKNNLKLETKNRTESYSKIRKHILKSIYKHGSIIKNYENYLEDSYNFSTPTLCNYDPLWHAFHMWRYRIEAIQPRDALDGIDDPIILNKSIISWPAINSVKTDAWLSFLLASWKADLITAKKWYDNMRKIATLTESQQQTGVLEEYLKCRIFLCPPLRHWPPQLSCISEGSSEYPDFIWLVG